MSPKKRRPKGRAPIVFIDIPTDSAKTRDEAWADVVTAIRAAAPDLQAEPTQPSLFEEESAPPIVNRGETAPPRRRPSGLARPGADL